MEELKQTLEQIQSDLKDIKDSNSKTNLRLQKLESVYSSDVSTTCTTITIFISSVIVSLPLYQALFPIDI